VGLAVGTNVVGRDDGVKLGLDVDGVKLGLDVDGVKLGLDVGRRLVGVDVGRRLVGVDVGRRLVGVLDVGRRLVGVLDVGLAVVWSIRRKLLSFPLSSAWRLFPRIEGDRAVPTPINESVITSWIMTAYR
jgi:hypothetical protein